MFKPSLYCNNYAGRYLRLESIKLRICRNKELYDPCNI